MKNFLQKHIFFILALGIVSAVISIILATILLGIPNRLFRPTGQQIATQDLLGPKNQLSARSKQQIETVLKETPHVVGGLASKLVFEKDENPIIFSWGHPVIAKVVSDFEATLRAGKGISSAERAASASEADKERLLRFSEEAAQGMIKCSDISGTNTYINTPEIKTIAKGVCYATLPPFTKDVNISIVTFIDIDGSNPANIDEIQKIRRSLLQLQLDIYSRDYQGRETWIHE